jgi:paraquat-inducible protein B
MSRRASPTLVGAFVVGAVTIAVSGLMVFSSGRLFRDRYPFVAYFAGSVSGLRNGAPVKFKGVEVGQVTGVWIDLGGRIAEANAIPVTFEIYQDRVRERGGEADLGNPEWIDGVIALGLRAQLLTESLVTGRLYVSLDLHPGSPAILRGGPETPYPEVPSLPTPFQEFQQQAAEFIAKFKAIDLESLSKSLDDALTGMSDFINSPKLADAVASLDNTLQATNEAVVELDNLLEDIDTQILPMAASFDSTRTAADITLAEAQATLEGIRVLLEPGSPLTYRLDAALKDISETARAMQALADYLERNPGALVRGRQVNEEKQ